MALQYPLLFLYVEDDFHEVIPYNTKTNRKKTTRQCATIRKFYAYRLGERKNDGETIRARRKLFQQYVVDAFTAIESER